MALYNKRNGEELKAEMLNSQEDRSTLSFYKYRKIEDPHVFRDQLFLDWE